MGFSRKKTFRIMQWKTHRCSMSQWHVIDYGFWCAFFVTQLFICLTQKNGWDTLRWWNPKNDMTGRVCVVFMAWTIDPSSTSLVFTHGVSLGRTPLMVAAASSLDDVRAPPSLGGNPDGVGPKVFFLHVYVQVFNQGYRTWIVTITYFHWAPDDWSRLGFIFRDVTLIPLEWSRFWKRVVLGMDISTPSIKPILSYLYDVYLVFLQICIRGSCNFTSCSSGCSSVMQLGSYPRKWCPIEKGLWMHTCAKLVLQKASQNTHRWCYFDPNTWRVQSHLLKKTCTCN